VIAFSSVKHSLLLSLVLLLFAGPAMGVCDVPQPRLVCAEYFASKVVVEASLVKVRTVRDKDDPQGIAAFVYTLRTDRLLRGQIDGVFQIYEGNDSGRATFDWNIGGKYLLFLFYLRTEKSWGLDGCGNSGPLSGAKSVLEQIEAIQTGHHDSGVIHGAVSEQALSAHIPGVRVEVRGTNGVYRATTNAKGEFEIKVPAGRYTVRAIQTGYTFRAADLSYENPDDVRIEPGGCAQVQLVAHGR
jgi:Carboxypeptidase regulatory-like domain